LTAEIQQMFTRQGWDIAWEYGRVGDSPQPARYLIRQRKWDESTQTFLNETTHEIGWIDTEGNLHTKVTRFSATENPDGTWTDTSTTQDIVIDLKNLPKNPDLIIKQQLDENGNPISFQEKLKTPGFHLLETKNPAFEKTGILTLTYLDENGAPQVVTYNRELNFLKIPEISTDLLHPTPIPIEAVHSLAALQFILLRYGDGESLPTDNFPGWAIQFQYFPDNGTKRAYLWPRSGKLTPKYIRFIGENNLNIPWFEIILPDGTSYPCAPVEIFNPKDPQNPKDGNEKLILFPALFTGTMTPSQRIEFLKSFPYDENIINELFGSQRLIIIATQPGSNGDGYFTVLYKTNGGGWNKVGDRRPLDSLLGMEKTKIEAMEYGGVYTIGPFKNEYDYMKANNLTVDEILIAVDINGVTKYVPLPILLQMVVLVISP
jgi:hypothetical protein